MSYRLKNTLVIITYMVLLFAIYPITKLGGMPVTVTCEMILIGLALCWTFSIERRVVSVHQRKYLMTIGYMVVFWMVVRCLKDSLYLVDFLYRYLWYFYQIPVVVISLMFLLLSIRLGKKDDYEIPKYFRFVYLFCLILCLLIVSNDIHNLVFTFVSGIESWEIDYTYGPAYWVLIIFVVLVAVTSFAIALKESVFSIVKLYCWVPIVPVLISGLFYTKFLSNLLEASSWWQLPEMYSFMVIGFFEGFIQIGLIPSNRKYDLYFKNSHLNAEIINQKGTVIYSSEAEEVNTDEEVDENEKKKARVAKSKNQLRHEEKIPGGKTVWIKDVTELNEIKKSIKEANDYIAENAERIKVDDKLRADQANILEKNMILDCIHANIKDQIDDIATLILEVNADLEKYGKNMRKASLLAAYVKRRANLEILAKDNNKIEIKELILAITETFRYLNFYGVSAMFKGESNEKMPSQTLMCIYEMIENAIECEINHLTGVSSMLTENDDNYVLKICLEINDEIDEDYDDTKLAKITKISGYKSINVELETEDNMKFITLVYRKEA